VPDRGPRATDILRDALYGAQISDLAHRPEDCWLGHTGHFLPAQMRRRALGLTSYSGPAGHRRATPLKWVRKWLKLGWPGSPHESILSLQRTDRRTRRSGHRGGQCSLPAHRSPGQEPRPASARRMMAAKVAPSSISGPGQVARVWIGGCPGPVLERPWPKDHSVERGRCRRRL
jgi:hypothetical protein